MVGPLRAELVAEIVGEQFPHLRPAEVAYIGEGCDSTAFDVNGELVFRFPKRSEVERQLFIETDILPLLAEHSPVPIPAFSFHGVPSPLFPRRFVGYPRLAGVPAIGLNLTQSQFLQLAPVLGGFLSFLHSFPVSTAAQVGVPEYPAEALIDDARVEALSDLHVVRHVGLDTSEEELRALLETRVDASVSPTLVHRDLAAEHILLDPPTRQVTGIIDWSEISVSDPAIDFAGMFCWGGLDFANAVLCHYHGESNAGLLHRARFFAARKGIGDIVFGLEMHRQEYIDSGVRALRFCLTQQERT